MLYLRCGLTVLESSKRVFFNTSFRKLSTMGRDYDIIVYGASGFTARYIIKELMETKYKIALSGRSEERIKKNVGFSPDTSSIPIFVSSIENLANISQKGKVLINCAGPYIHCGEEVVKACISTGTHYVDITGEAIFVDDIIAKYHEEATLKNVIVIPCCGYDSIPADVGVMYLKQILGSRPIWSRSYMHMQNSYANRTSYETLVYNVGRIRDFKKSARVSRRSSVPGEMGKETIPFKKDKIKQWPFFNPLTQTYCTIFPGSDAPTVRRSQKLLKEIGLEDPIQYGAYYSVGNFVSLTFFLSWVATFFIISQFEFGRNLLIKYPGFFTFGRVKKEGPSEEMIRNSRFKIIFEGLCETSEGAKEHVVAKLSGPDPGYVTTPICASTCAVMLTEMVNGEWQSAFKGGVLTPASVFHGTDFIERLKKKGMKFEELERKIVRED